MGAFNKGYANLFGMEDEEGDEEGEEPTDEGEDEGGNKPTNYLEEFSKRWGWLDLAVRVKEIKSVTLDDVYELNIIEFLNYVGYNRAKVELEKYQQAEFVKKQKRP